MAEVRAHLKRGSETVGVFAKASGTDMEFLEQERVGSNFPEDLSKGESLNPFLVGALRPAQSRVEEVELPKLGKSVEGKVDDFCVSSQRVSRETDGLDGVARGVEAVEEVEEDGGKVRTKGGGDILEEDGLDVGVGGKVISKVDLFKYAQCQIPRVWLGISGGR